MNFTLTFMVACYAESSCGGRKIRPRRRLEKMKAVRSYFAGIHRMLHPLAVLVFLVVADGIVTNVLVNSGVAREGNPFLVSLVGDGSFVALKAVGAFFCALLLWDISRHRPRMAVISTSCLAVAYAGIVSWNLALLFTSQV